MSLRSLSLLAALVAIPTAACAQEFTGEFELTGAFSNRRKAKVKLVVSPNGKVVRSAEITSGSAAGDTTYWRASSRRIAGRRMIVTYPILPEEGSLFGMVDALPFNAEREDVVDTLRAETTVRALYTLSADGGSITEVAVNLTRAGAERSWSWFSAKGERDEVVYASGAPLSEEALDAITEKAQADWIRARAEAHYADDPDGTLADLAHDSEFDNVFDVLEVDPARWMKKVKARYDAGRLYRDPQGRYLLRKEIVIHEMWYTPRYADGERLFKVFVFSRLDGSLVDIMLDG